MTREEMKTMFLQMDCSNVPVRKEIIVDLRYLDNKWWPNHGYVEIEAMDQTVTLHLVLIKKIHYNMLKIE